MIKNHLMLLLKWIDSDRCLRFSMRLFFVAVVLHLATDVYVALADEVEVTGDATLFPELHFPEDFFITNLSGYEILTINDKQICVRGTCINLTEEDAEALKKHMESCWSEVE